MKKYILVKKVDEAIDEFDVVTWYSRLRGGQFDNWEIPSVTKERVEVDATVRIGMTTLQEALLRIRGDLLAVDRILDEFELTIKRNLFLPVSDGILELVGYLKRLFVPKGNVVSHAVYKGIYKTNWLPHDVLDLLEELEKETGYLPKVIRSIENKGVVFPKEFGNTAKVVITNMRGILANLKPFKDGLKAKRVTWGWSREGELIDFKVK